MPLQSWTSNYTWQCLRLAKSLHAWLSWNEKSKSHWLTWDSLRWSVRKRHRWSYCVWFACLDKICAGSYTMQTPQKSCSSLRASAVLWEMVGEGPAPPVPLSHHPIIIIFLSPLLPLSRAVHQNPWRTRTNSDCHKSTPFLPSIVSAQLQIHSALSHAQVEQCQENDDLPWVHKKELFRHLNVNVCVIHAGTCSPKLRPECWCRLTYCTTIKVMADLVRIRKKKEIWSSNADLQLLSDLEDVYVNGMRSYTGCRNWVSIFIQYLCLKRQVFLQPGDWSIWLHFNLSI